MQFYSNLKFNYVKNCFIQVPKSVNISSDENVVAVKLQSTTGSLISSVEKKSSLTSVHDEVEINGIFAVKNGLSNHQDVVITVLNNVPTCTRVHVEPVSADDWEIININTSLLEESILNQVRVVTENQILPIWVKGSICLFVKVAKIEPSCEFVFLMENTEVIVSPLLRNYHMTNNDNKTSTELVGKNNSQTERIKNKMNDNVGVDTSSPLSSSSSSVDSFQYEMASSTDGNNKTTINFIKSSFHSMKEWCLSYFSCEQNLLKLENLRRNFYESCHLKLNKRIICRVLALEKFLKVNKEFAGLNCVSFSNTYDSSLNTDDFNNLYHISPFKVYISKDYLEKSLGRNIYKHEFSTYLVKFSSPQEKYLPVQNVKKSARSAPKDEVKNSNSLERFFVTVHLLTENDVKTYIKKTFFNFILIPSGLRKLLNLQITSKVCLEDVDKLKQEVINIRELFVYPLAGIPEGFTFNLVTISLVNYFISLIRLTKNSILLNEIGLLECFLKDNSMVTCCISFKDLSASTLAATSTNHMQRVCYLGDEDLGKIKFIFKQESINLPIHLNQNIDIKIPHIYNKNKDVEFLQETFKDIENYFEFLQAFSVAKDNNSVIKPGNVLIYGSKGTGKTVFCECLKVKLESQLSAFYVEYINCKEFSNKPIGNLKQKFQKIYEELKYRQPSILILDDLDSVAKNNSNHDTDQSDMDRHHSKVSILLGYLLSNLVSGCGLIITISISESLDTLNKSFLKHHIFDKYIEIKADSSRGGEKLILIKKQIDYLISSIPEFNIKNCISEHLNISKLDGYVPFDIESIAKQTIHNKLSEIQEQYNCTNVSSKVNISDEDVYNVFSTYKPIHLRFTKLFEPPNITWTDVGGLKQVKKTLIESLLWPSTYSKLFTNYPLPLRTGVLLYGAQGTGKTLLASAVASECKLNIISIKGPELLNKFIGASEKAVRDTFQRAKNASPCIIFFDELDSLAPRRGKDSTGVTDRVVNQLLAELDGVEELEGVYVLAATSRPDLIDPALLRPGRLDKLLYFSLPDAEERLEILHALTKNITLHDNVKLKTLAKNTHGYTGADLKALLYNALLEVTHQLQNVLTNEDGDGINKDCVLTVKMEHLRTALSKTQPSILQKDEKRFDEIYSSFNGINKTDSINVIKTVGVKATFA